MSRLVALYPRTWRERYEVEFLALMADRPPSPGDRLDVIRGALDARLHPQLDPSRSGEPESSRPAWLGTALAVLAGLLWAAAGVAFAASSIDPTLGYKRTDGAVLLAVAAAFVAGLTALVVTLGLPGRHRMALAGAIVAIGGALAMLLPWPIVFVGFFGTLLGGSLFGIAALSRLGGSGILLFVASVVALGFNTEDQRALFLIPLGSAWILVGILLAVRRVPDAPSVPPVDG
jgi:hypothetical protein